MDKNPTNVFPNSFPRRQNCKTALVEKIPKEPVTFFFYFISAIYPTIHPRILASFSSLFMIHPEFWEQGGFRTTIPSFQIFAFNYFLSIFALPYSPLLSECQKRGSPTLYFSTPNPRLLHCNTSDFCALKNTLYVPKVSF